RMAAQNLPQALNEAGDDLLALPFEARPYKRIKQFDGSRGVRDFAEQPAEIIEELERRIAPTGQA
ncbi:MAG: hypothetical protein ACOC9P_02435, partial [bacterium]